MKGTTMTEVIEVIDVRLPDDNRTRLVTGTPMKESDIIAVENAICALANAPKWPIHVPHACKLIGLMDTELVTQLADSAETIAAFAREHLRQRGE
jgi:hypothetical protein